MLGPYTFKRSSHPTLRPFVERRDRVRVRDTNDVRVCARTNRFAGKLLSVSKVVVMVKMERLSDLRRSYANRDCGKIILQKLLGIYEMIRNWKPSELQMKYKKRKREYNKIVLLFCKRYNHQRKTYFNIYNFLLLICFWIVFWTNCICLKCLYSERFGF